MFGAKRILELFNDEVILIRTDTCKSKYQIKKKVKLGHGTALLITCKPVHLFLYLLCLVVVDPSTFFWIRHGIVETKQRDKHNILSKKSRPVKKTFFYP